MHCVSCESLIEKDLFEKIKEAKISISHKSGILEIESNSINEEDVRGVVEKLGYKISKEADKNKQANSAKSFTWRDFYQVVIIFILLFIALFLLSKLGLSNYFPTISSDVGILVALLVGLVASLSTCLAMVGGLVMGLSSQYKVTTNEHDTEKISLAKRSKPQIFFHLGRVLGFFLLGGVLGYLGGAVRYSTSFTGFLTMLVALVMLYIALQILGILPNITKLGFYLPKKLSGGIFNIKTKDKPMLIAFLGSLTFFLPCGFTQSMQLAAIASGGFLPGALIMSFFAIGTIPVLFAVGLGSSYAQHKKFSVLKKIIAVLIIMFAFYSLNSGLVLSGSRFSLDFWTQFVKAENNNIDVVKESTSDSQTVQLDIDYTFKQREIRIKKDVPVKFVVNPIRVTGCSNEVIIPSLGLSTGKLTNGKKVTLEFTPTKTGSIPFSCWMGMINGKFIVY